MTIEAYQLQFQDYDSAFSATTQIMGEMIRHYAKHPEIRRAAIYIAGPAPERADLQIIDRIFTFVRDGIKYRNDIRDVETLQTPPETLRLQAGDCDDQVMLLNALIEAVGYHTRFVCISDRPGGHAYTHVYSQVKGPGGEWLGMDPTRRVRLGMEPADVTRRDKFEY